MDGEWHRPRNVKRKDPAIPPQSIHSDKTPQVGNPACKHIDIASHQAAETRPEGKDAGCMVRPPGGQEEGGAACTFGWFCSAGTTPEPPADPPSPADEHASRAHLCTCCQRSASTGGSQHRGLRDTNPASPEEPRTPGRELGHQSISCTLGTVHHTLMSPPPKTHTRTRHCSRTPSCSHILPKPARHPQPPSRAQPSATCATWRLRDTVGGTEGREGGNTWNYPDPGWARVCMCTG